MAKLSIIVLQFNKSDYTLACLESLKTLDANVIVVDNGSEVKHLKNVEYWIDNQKLKNFSLIASPENLGYSGGNNLGIKKALATGAEYVLLLNNDTVVAPEFLERMLEVDSDMVGIEERSVKGPFHLFYYLPGVALLIKKRVFEKIGFLDERYFLYYEDVEFSERARRTGFHLSVSKKTQVQHAVSATTKSLGAADLLYYHTRNLFLLLETYYPRLTYAPLPTWKLWIKLKQRIKIALGRDVEISRAILQGINDYDHHRFGMRVH